MRFAQTDQRMSRTDCDILTAVHFAGLLLLVALAAGCGNRNEPRRVESASPTESPKVATPTAQDTRIPTPLTGGESQASGTTVATTDAAGSPEDQRRNAGSLYALHCAGCHGEKGNGVSVASRFLFPKPRDFRADVGFSDQLRRLDSPGTGRVGPHLRRPAHQSRLRVAAADPHQPDPKRLPLR